MEELYQIGGAHAGGQAQPGLCSTPNGTGLGKNRRQEIRDLPKHCVHDGDIARIRMERGPQRGFMANDKKPKKAKPAVVHGATSRGAELSGKLAEPVKKSPLTPGKKKK